MEKTNVMRLNDGKNMTLVRLRKRLVRIRTRFAVAA